ncbi:TrkH-domain-containing protein [Aureobasidium sp. EXF-3400]|nr:TrkH-domain-containing protein [Aureobasidium sp. EXF-12344]KAI4773649.1 TrkH-domain-containing protein [Aureobasidium sp. EXF-3400]
MMAHLKSWRDHLPSWLRNIRLNFYRLHLYYFIFTILLSSIIVYGSTTNGNSGNAQNQFNLRYIDALFLCASAMTNSGLNVVNLGAITGFQQAVLFILIPLGNVMVVSMSTVYIRKYFFRKKIRHFLHHSKAGRQVANDIERDSISHQKIHDTHQSDRTVNPSSSTVPNDHNMTAELRSRKAPKKDPNPHHLTHFGGFPFPWESVGVQNILHAPFQRLHSRPQEKAHDYLSFKPALDSRGRFLSLDERQREELGGVEYKALHLLGWLLPAYLVFWFLLGIVILVPYSYYGPLANVLRTSQPGNLEPGCLLDQNMIAVRGYELTLIVTGALILVGNQLYPVFLRFIIWCLYKLVPKDSELHHTCAFLLHHPRRCFILLFPSINTWYLLAAQLGIDFFLWAFFGILNLGLPAIQSMSAGQQTLVGLYQGLGVRVGGLYAVLISSTAPALQILYLAGMYISGFPIIVSLRQTNIYEERSLGIENNSDEDAEKKGEQSYISEHIRKQLAYDLWWLILAIWLITIIERHDIVAGGEYFTIWAIVFETVSAYGTVGLSLGVPYDNYSFSGTWHTLSKLILICVMIRGRHRGLPYAIDRAVLLPGEELMEKMDKEVNGRRGNKNSAQWNEEEQRVRREEEGSQAESQDRGQDPEGHEVKGTQEGPS